MKVSTSWVYGGSRATALRTLLLTHHRSTFRCCSSCSASAYVSPPAAADHESFIKDVVATQPPEHLCQLMEMLRSKGEFIIPPGAKQGLVPLAIPLSKNSSGTVTSLLRWPTAPSGMEMPVVEVHKHGVWFLAKNVDQYIHRILVEDEANTSPESKNELYAASAEAGEKLYKKGDFAESQMSNLDNYLLRKVGLFPDVIERKAMHYLEKGDHVAALVTAEFYSKKGLFPGFGRPFVFNAELLLKVGRTLEAKDAARGALKSPWWTLGCKYQEVADIAQLEGEEKVTEEGRHQDLERGKEPAQVALDEAAFLLDLASVEGTWDESVERIAECYEAAGLHDIARFVSFRDLILV